MAEDTRPADALSRAELGSYSFTLYCTNMRPRCGHGMRLDVAATIARFGDRTWSWVRRRARCTVCGHRGASLIMAPIHTGPADLDPFNAKSPGPSRDRGHQP